ncbi:YsnF/AvaK domain-containing protein [Deinococcus sp. YIM 77859]|uniref:YsnF/AvaK domain-containing protein n=1 Tax=Deinococcus sp. YIM 77859 TaxID=1540221 RepID=UPI00068BE246|nr:YsnF/AvaK domain-containing protein [Deinococcus sp. YIM 77859]
MDERETGEVVRDSEGRQIVQRLVLHEERATVDVVREAAGSVEVRRVVTERQETVPITLYREVLEITVKDGGGQVLMNGEALEPGRTYEIPISEERAEVRKQVYPFQEVIIAKELRRFTQDEQVTLRREELDVQHLNVTPDATPRTNDSQR